MTHLIPIPPLKPPYISYSERDPNWHCGGSNGGRSRGGAGVEVGARVGALGGGGGGALTMVLGTHCKTDSRSCGCSLEKGELSWTQELSVGGLSERHFLLGL